MRNLPYNGNQQKGLYLNPKGQENIYQYSQPQNEGLQGSHRAGMNAILQPRDRNYLTQMDLNQSWDFLENLPVKKNLG